MGRLTAHPGVVTLIARVDVEGERRLVGHRLLDHEEAIDLAFSPDGRVLAVGGARSVRLWAGRSR